MAATLAQIKSRMLLPVHDEEESMEDPRLEIARPLQEYLAIKSAAEELSKRNILGEHTFVRRAPAQEIRWEDENELLKVGLFELIDAFQKILTNLSPDHRVDMTTDRVSVKDRINQLIDLLEEKNSVTFDELFEGAVQKSDVIVTFLAILEMVKLSLITVVQHMESGIIRIFYQ